MCLGDDLLRKAARFRNGDDFAFRGLLQRVGGVSLWRSVDRVLRKDSSGDSWRGRESGTHPATLPTAYDGELEGLIAGRKATETVRHGVSRRGIRRGAGEPDRATPCAFSSLGEWDRHHGPMTANRFCY